MQLYICLIVLYIKINKYVNILYYTYCTHIYIYVCISWRLWNVDRSWTPRLPEKHTAPRCVLAASDRLLACLLSLGTSWLRVWTWGIPSDTMETLCFCFKIYPLVPACCVPAAVCFAAAWLTLLLLACCCLLLLFCCCLQREGKESGKRSKERELQGTKASLRAWRTLLQLKQEEWP